MNDEVASDKTLFGRGSRKFGMQQPYLEEKSKSIEATVEERERNNQARGEERRRVCKPPCSHIDHRSPFLFLTHLGRAFPALGARLTGKALLRLY